MALNQMNLDKLGEQLARDAVMMVDARQTPYNIGDLLSFVCSTLQNELVAYKPKQNETSVDTFN